MGEEGALNYESIHLMDNPIESELLVRSIEYVWNERDDNRRLEVMKDIYHPDAVIFEPARSVTGHPAISEVVRDVLKGMPAGFSFRVTGPTVGHHNVATTQWEGGPADEVTVRGSDVIRVQDGLILEHYFFFYPAPSA